MAYGNNPADIEAAGRQLAQVITNFNSRIEAVEAKPNLDRMTEEWARGREIAARKGYGRADLEALEEQMQARGIMRHADAIRLELVSPSGQAVIGGLPADEFQKLISGDETGFERLAIARALNDVR